MSRLDTPVNNTGHYMAALVASLRECGEGDITSTKYDSYPGHDIVSQFLLASARRADSTATRVAWRYLYIADLCESLSQSTGFDLSSGDVKRSASRSLRLAMQVELAQQEFDIGSLATEAATIALLIEITYGVPARDAWTRYVTLERMLPGGDEEATT